MITFESLSEEPIYMDSNFILKWIFEDIKRAYGSFDEPSFAFVMESYKKNLYQPVIETFIDSQFTVIEQTDLNDDVCLVLEISKNNKFWIVRFSLVGRYSIVFRRENLMNTMVCECNCAEENDILAIIGVFLIHNCLDEKIISKSISFVTPRGKVANLYNCLFSKYW